MSHRPLALCVVVVLAGGACAEVLGLDEPTVREEGAGGAPPTSGTTSTGGGSPATGTGGPGGAGPGGGAASTGGGGAGGCQAHADCDDDNPCTIDVCTAGACVNEASDTQPADDPDDCVDVSCTGDVPTFTPDDTEIAAHTKPPCHMAECQGGVAVDILAPAGEACGDPPLECDGRGVCTGCTVDEDCSGADGPCSVPACQDDGTCDPGILEQGTVVDDPEGNCFVAVCTGASSTPNSTYDPDDLPAPITCAVITCKPDGPDVRPANDGVPCTVGDFTGVCIGNETGDAACVECEEQRDCDLRPGGGRCIDSSDTCGCSFDGDCQGFWRAGSECLSVAGQQFGVCGCEAAADCTGNMHGDACLDAACGCAADADCLGSELGPTCVLAEDRCGCAADAECASSALGTDCLAGAMRCGCDTDADCVGLGGNCLESLGICS